MPDDLYYRGSSSYEVAVNNKLELLAQSGVRNTTAIVSGLRNLEYSIHADIRESTRAILASQEYLERTIEKGFSALNNTLQIGFEMLFKEMSAVCERLDEIHDILNNPRLTAARELYRKASENFEKGYFEEALEDCKQAVEKEKTDFISWYLLGQIYLYGAGKYSNVIDLHKAEEAFEMAAKYIDADLGKTFEADELGSQIYYHLGCTKWLLSNDLLIEGKADESNSKLSDAEKNSSEAYHLSEKNLKARYDNAKHLHFLGRDAQALDILKDLIKSERSFAILAVNDKNFESIWSDIEKTILELCDEVIKENENYAISLKNKFDTFLTDYPGLKEIVISKQADIDSILSSKDKSYLSLKNGSDELREVESYMDNLVKQLKDYYLDENDFVRDNGFIPYGVTKINNNLFKECSWLKSIKIPDSVTSIGDSAFRNCENLRRVTIPDSVTSIGDSAFRNCENLTSVTIPDSVTSIGGYAFESCNSLTSVVIPGSVTSIGKWAFAWCHKLNKVVISDGVTSIGDSAFYDCRSLTSCNIPPNAKVESNAFLGTQVKIESGCYVATCVYGSYDCPQVWTLRRFRDNTLGATWYGRLFIKTYYAISPTLVKWFGKTSWFKNMWKPTLDKMVSKLQAKGVESSPYEDKMWM